LKPDFALTTEQQHELDLTKNNVIKIWAQFQFKRQYYTMNVKIFKMSKTFNKNSLKTSYAINLAANKWYNCMKLEFNIKVTAKF
jgi:hypothetical protein